MENFTYFACINATVYIIICNHKKNKKLNNDNNLTAHVTK